MNTSGPSFFSKNKPLRTVRFAFMLTPRERLALDNLADHEGGLSLSAYLRRLIRKTSHDFGMWPAEEPEIAKTGEREVTMEK